MGRVPVRWDPRWDDDWQSLADRLEEDTEDHPRTPKQAVEFYRYGFAKARRHPAHMWPEVEREFYEDYMSGAPAPGTEVGDQEAYDKANVWVRRGWEAGRE